MEFGDEGAQIVLNGTLGVDHQEWFGKLSSSSLPVTTPCPGANASKLE